MGRPGFVTAAGQRRSEERLILLRLKLVEGELLPGVIALQVEGENFLQFRYLDRFGVELVEVDLRVGQRTTASPLR